MKRGPAWKIVSFFLRHEKNNYEGLKSLRYRYMSLFEPVFIALSLGSSLIVQSQLYQNGMLYQLLLFLSLQMLIILIINFLKPSRLVDKSFFLYIFTMMSFFTATGVNQYRAYLWIFLCVLVSALLYRIRKTAIVYLLLAGNIVFINRYAVFQALSMGKLSLDLNSIGFYTMLTSFLTGASVSVIVNNLEKSFAKLYKLKKTLENRNSKLSREQEVARHYRNALMGNELKFKTIVEYAFDGITILDKNGNNKFISNSTENITGYSSEEFSEGAMNLDRIHPDDLQRVIENFRNITEGRIDKSTIYYRYLHKDGEWRNLEVTVTDLLNNPGIEGILFIYRDVTRHIQAEQRARYFEFYDQLTGLPNLLMFSEKISEEIERSAARKRSFAVMCLGLNSFKDINGQFGTSFGDILLKQIGSRLKSNFRGDDFVSRMMGDKFLILFSDMKSEDDVIAIVQKTMGSFETPFWVEQRDIAVSVSIGISVYPHDGTLKDELIKNSEAALFLCKENRDRKYAMFNKNQNEDLINRIQIEKEIYQAIEDKTFTVYYQPKVDLDGNLVGAEALIRWFHRERGMVSPGQFIPISERNRSIIEIGKIVMEKTYSQIREWIDSGLEPVEISINVAPMQFSDRGFIDYIDELQNRYDIDPDLIEFEITETGIMENEKKTTEIMHLLIERGYSISIDDFGTGYSSLNKLKDYPVTTLKIDKSFIDPLPDNASSNIVKTIIELAHFLQYRVVAEGVEKEEQHLLLATLQCDMIQGYFFHKPMPSTHFVKLMKKPASAL
ncbi:putative bifunctional diguanylate cyclase/phosphodiesterase [Spirochaeta isovalerica]|uniref:Diguanylate cyclase (GGDEF)-like protein/PAS domain S-box-containing protein n=1 Tax=Spirochaeta isovalerica TaxID=150 RepID=A0A841R655_9SPIO|nr:bifunctional diguanylate cyclase/phosphodiesterase [Spirochaeta isovalerica]MBB6478530.1 diguanylate cyclase (GGDEF)-like protein/PAS domain S-box-containing protein [Spirochaeta isovalerica]